MKHSLCFLTLILLSACSTGDYTHYLRLYDIPPPKVEDFTHCYDYGCKTRVRMALPNKTIKKLNTLFKNAPAKTAESERKKITKAIGLLETDIGALTGTKNDKYGTFRLYQDSAETTRKFQQDCIDESTNTTIYVGLLEQLKLLQYHRPVFAASRQPFLSGAPWWHQTAVIQDIETGERFALDSWFEDNGKPAYIVALPKWKNGWLPDRSVKKN